MNLRFQPQNLILSTVTHDEKKISKNFFDSYSYKIYKNLCLMRKRIIERRYLIKFLSYIDSNLRLREFLN